MYMESKGAPLHTSVSLIGCVLTFLWRQWFIKARIWLGILQDLGLHGESETEVGHRWSTSRPQQMILAFDVLSRHAGDGEKHTRSNVALFNGDKHVAVTAKYFLFLFYEACGNVLSERNLANEWGYTAGIGHKLGVHTWSLHSTSFSSHP